MVEMVAEISGNHGGDLFKARELIIEAANAGCDYAKFQFFRPAEMPDYEDNAEMYEKLYVRSEWLPPLFEIAKDCSIGLFASVFSLRAAEELLQYDVPYVKLAAPESTRLDSWLYCAIADLVFKTTTRLIVSGSLSPRGRLPASRRLYCPSGHPPVLSQKEKEEYLYEPYYDGLSDHTPGIADPLWFCDHPKTRMIEKHFKLENDNDCIDAAFSADPKTMKLLCRLAHNR